MPAFHAAGGTTSASSASCRHPAATFRSALCSLRFQPRRRRASSPWPRSSDRGAPPQTPRPLPPTWEGRPQSRLFQFTLSALYYAPGCKSVPSLAQRAPSSVTLRFAQGKPSVLPRLISFATLTAGLRSIFALSCFVRSPNSQPLTTFILSTFPHQQRWSLSHSSLCSFFLEQSDDRLHLRNFPLRLSPYAAHLSPVPLAPFSRRVAPPDQWR